MSFFVILGLTYIVVLLAIWHRPLFDTFKAHTDRQIRPVTQLVLEMLERPEGWSFDGYRAKHATGAAIWIATRPDAAALSLDGDVSPHGSYNAGKPVVETNLRERRKLYAAAIALRDRNAAEEHRAKVTEWANRVETYADNVVKLGGKR